MVTSRRCVLTSTVFGSVHSGARRAGGVLMIAPMCQLQPAVACHHGLSRASAVGLPEVVGKGGLDEGGCVHPQGPEPVGANLNQQCRRHQPLRAAFAEKRFGGSGVVFAAECESWEGSSSNSFFRSVPDGNSFRMPQTQHSYF